MKGLAIILTGLLLMPGVGTARAAAESYVSGSAALYFDTDQDLRDDNDKGRLTCQPTAGWGYAISQQLTIDLQCRLFAAKENSPEFDLDKVDLAHITQNLLLGFSYKF